MHPAASPSPSPGTRSLIKSRLSLQPQPQSEYRSNFLANNFQNWSRRRKFLNFALATCYTLFTFVLLDIGIVIWGQLNDELGISFQNLDNAFAANCAGLAVGAIFLLPIAHKYGRRPLYLFSLAVQFACALWFAKMKSNAENIIVNVISGLGGAVSEAIVQMTVADIFFVHQRARANALYVFTVTTGSLVAPVGAGLIADAQGWRWIFWWTAVLLGLTLVVAAFFFEETKYTGARLMAPQKNAARHNSTDSSYAPDGSGPSQRPESAEALIPAKRSYRQRLALLTPTPDPVLRHTWQPFVVLFQFPAVLYTALMYGSQMAWFSVISTTASTYLLEPPYNFTSTGIGLMSLAPFIGCILASIVGGPCADAYILRMARRNGGVFEPEMRLHLSLVTLIICPAGILVYGLGLAKGSSWVVLGAGCALYGFAWVLVGDISLTYLIDCYQDIVGDSLVAVAFVRNGVATIIVFAMTPWIDNLGLYNFFVSVGVIALLVLLTTLPMIWYGKRCRRWTRERYRQLASCQATSRTFVDD